MTKENIVDLEVSLKEHIESRFVAFNARLDSYINAHREMHEKLAEQAAQTLTVIERRLESMNELRQQINAERGQFVSRDMLDQRFQVYTTRVDELGRRMDQRFEDHAKRMSDMERGKANMDGRFSMLAMVLGGLTVFLNLILNYFVKVR